MIPRSDQAQRWRRRWRWLLVIALWINTLGPLLLPAATIQAATPSAATAEGALRVAYLHGGDTLSAASFAALLNDNGFMVQAFNFGAPPSEFPHRLLLPFVVQQGGNAASQSQTNQAQLIGALPNFAAFDLIVVAADSGAGDQWQPEAGLFEAVRDAGLPVIGLGAGGHALLGRLGLPIGYPNGNSSTTAALAVSQDGLSQAFYANITLSGDNLLPIYTSDQTAIAVPLPETPVDGARLAALPGNAGQYPIAKAGRYFLWGMAGAPTAMTDTGKQLFLNLARFATEKLEIQLRARTFTPTPGLDADLVAALQGSSGLHAFAQLAREPSTEEREALAAIGIRLVAFVGNHLYTAFVTPTPATNHPTFQGIIRWLGPIQPTDKVDPKILAGQFEAWADNGNGTIKVLIHFHEDVAAATATEMLAQLGITAELFSAGVYAANVSPAAVTQIAAQDSVRWIEEGPLPNLPENDSTRAELHVNEAQAANINGSSIFYAGLDGSGVSVAVFDSGINANNAPGMGHNDFAGRLLRTSDDSNGHGTHVAGIIGASGANSVTNCPFGVCTAFQMRGMAPGVQLAPYGSRDAASFDEAVNTYGVELSNSSQYQTCGAYDSHAQLLDQFIRGDGTNGGTSVAAHQMVKSAGNSGTSGQYCDAAGYFAITGSAKNLLVVGALNAESNLDLRSSSSRGPTWDGRLKPDVMGIGCGDSTDNASQGYVSKCGTSMAAPSVTGILALMTEQYHHSFPTAGRPRPSTLRAVVIQTADDLIHDPAQPGFTEYGWNDPDTGNPVIYHAGPDWATGYGVANAQRATAAIRAYNFVEGTVSPGDPQDTYVLNVPAGTPELKFTLVWDDEAGNPMLAVTAAQLVNNLDITLEGPGGVVIRPWVLAPLPASSDLPGGDADPIVRNTHIVAATRNVDNLNNTEQVQVANPAAGTWTIRINAASLPNGNAQPYSLAGDFRTLNIVSPQTGNVAEAGDPANPNVVPVIVEAVRSIDNTPSALSDATAADFSVQIDGTPATIVNGAPVGDQFWMMVRPAAGVYSAGSKYDLNVTWTGHGTDSETRAILFTEREITDRAVVIDRSGSMSDYDKMAAAQNAARLFIDQSLADDRIAVVSFSNNSTVNYPTTLVPNLGPTAILDAAKAAVDGLTPSGMTAIGQGLLDGQAQVTAAPADHSVADVVILLSDGMENVDPLYNTPAVKGVIEPTDTIVHTVAVGPASAGFHSLLATIANDNGGEFRAVNEDGAGMLMAAEASAAAATPTVGIEAWPQTLPNRLGDVYKQYAEEILNESRLFQARGVGNPVTGALQTFTVDVPEGLSRINFSFNWAQPNSEGYFQVVDPKENVYFYKGQDPNNKSCRGDATHIVCIIDAPIPGTWTMSIRIGGESNEWALWVSAKAAVSFHLWVGTPERQRVMGEPVHLLGFLGQGEKALVDQSIKLNIFAPGGGSRTIELFDDGQHGDGLKGDGLYGNYFGEGYSPGAYAVRGVATGQDLLNQPYTLFKNTGFHLRPRVAYVHKGDLDTANAYRQLIEENGVAVDQLTMDQLPSTNLQPYSLVIVAPETGSLGEWGTGAMVRRIIEFKKPVLGLGEGGYAYFGKLKLDIGWANGAHSAGDSVVRENYNDAFWHYPYDFLVDEKRIWQLYAEPSSRVDIFLGKQPLGLTVFGYYDATGQYADLVMEDGRYLLWGFDKGPKSMTDDGRKLFVNAVYRTMQ
ncbi:MAG: S8 family serine peptidase [Caldilineaceae bacterium]|nr:S8 family serine peptidase [Caldilineaceae bacterium]